MRLRNLWAVRLEPRLLTIASSITAFLRAETGQPTSRVAPFAWRFAFNDDERAFARELLRHKGNFWLYRTHQQRYCGDFAAIDMSSPDPSRRSVTVIDLKRGAPLKEGGGGASNQLVNAEVLVRRLGERTGIVGSEQPPRLLTGDRQAVLGALGVPKAA